MSDVNEHSAETDCSPDLRGAFESDTVHRLAVEAARFWVIEHWLRTKTLPHEPETRFVYADGPHGIGWGNAPGPDDADLKPLRYRRIRVTFEIEDQAR